MNLVIGDHIKFTLPKFTGGSFSFSGGRRRARGGTHVGDESFSGRIEREWYDSNNRHWFSIRLDSGKVRRVQGRNLYPAVTSHEPGNQHAEAASEKHARKEIGY